MTLARALLALTLLAAAPVHAGVVVEGKRGADRELIAVEGKSLRAEGKDERGRYVLIFDGEAKKVLRLDTEARSYSEFTEGDAARLRAELSASLAQLPPEHRAQLEETLKGRAPGAAARPRWEKTGRVDAAAGKPCDVYRVIRAGDAPAEEVCIVPFGAYGISKSDFAALSAFEDFARSIAVGAIGEVDTVWSDAPGIPVVTWQTEGGKRSEIFRATRVEKKTVAADQFKAPAGWKKETMQ